MQKFQYIFYKYLMYFIVYLNYFLYKPSRMSEDTACFTRVTLSIPGP